ncbi:rhamnogalacturonan lyase family protein [Paenibacillus abyssi]|uniref:BIG2 domain-containing protein n=1 Tax=Paenibacillus abyssi TaxID=1340531 RepID=A0A917FSC3_9BACL|nr:cadherin-like beta sandwich domain-containing protein [Paenibacillus abyssi]GGG03871.1 hypothetical protein GCM10010916_21180 [Paenibacillus abyssi]
MLKRKKSHVLVSKLLTAVLIMTLIMPVNFSTPAAAADTILISDDFSSYSAGPLTIGSGNSWAREGTAPIVNIVQDAEAGGAHAEISHDGTGSSYFGQRFAAQNGGLILEFDVNLPTNKGGTFWVMDGRINATSAGILRYQMDNGVIKRHGGTEQINYDPSHWYRFKIIFNIPQRKYTVNILNLNDGSTVTWPAAFYSDRARISSFGFFVNAGGGKFNLANVRLTALDLALNDLKLSSDNAGFTPSMIPPFDPKVENYTVDVPHSVDSLFVTPEASNPDGVQVKVGDETAASGTSIPVAVSGMSTDIGVTVASSVYTDVYRTYRIQVNKLEKSPNLNFVTSEARNEKVLIGWEETVDPSYMQANIYMQNPDQSLNLVDSVPKGKYRSSITGLTNGTTYTFIVKGLYDDMTESSGVTVSATPAYQPSRQMESLNRGMVAIKEGGGVYVGWRMFGTDPESIAFNLYRDGVKVNAEPITGSTNYLDADGTSESSYYVRPIIGEIEQRRSETVKVWDMNYLEVPLQKPADGVSMTGESYTYRANDASAGDLDGDGEYEIILKWDPSNSKDNSQSGYTGNTYIDAYKQDGTLMWRINLGRNIRSGAHYTQFMVYDLDGDGKAEFAFKTADGTIDGKGNVIGDPNADYRNSGGYVLAGPEYFTVFEGATGKALATDSYEPPRGNVGDWGDTYGNRVDRFLAGVAYLDGERPSVVMQRGYYTRMVLVAYNWRDGQLTKQWTFDSNTPGNESYYGQGNHQLSIADVDGDGRDEIITGPAAIDDNGQGLWNSRLGHGDAMHLGDLDPDRLGLELYAVQEDTNARYSASVKDAKTGRVLWGQPQIGIDVGRGLSADIDPRYKGNEVWSISGAWNSSTGGLYSAQGEKISTSIPTSNFAIWWDGDLSRELLDHDWLGDPLRVGIPKIDKWDYENNQLVNIERFTGTYSNNDTKGNPSLQADLFGDWREEVIVRTEDSSALRIYSTTDLTDHRIYTLMHDPVYRLGIAWQNTAYNQPPHTSFYLGNDMEAPPKPNIRTTPVLASGIAVSSAANVTVAGEQLQFDAVFTPAAATDQSVTWSVVNEDGTTASVAAIDHNGLLTAYAAGKVIVTAMAGDGSGVTGEAHVTIKAAYVSPGKVTQAVKADADGRALASVAAEDLRHAIDTASGRTLTIEILPPAEAIGVQVSLPAQELKAAEKKRIRTIEVQLGPASYTMDLDTIEEAVGKQSSKVEWGVSIVEPSTLSAKEKKQVGSSKVYDFDFTIDGKKVKDLDDDVKVEVDYTLKPDENAKKIIIYYVDDKGKLKTVKNGKYNASTGKAEFELENF